jgi:hypothetical protein
MRVVLQMCDSVPCIHSCLKVSPCKNLQLAIQRIKTCSILRVGFIATKLTYKKAKCVEVCWRESDRFCQHFPQLLVRNFD